MLSSSSGSSTRIADGFALTAGSQLFTGHIMQLLDGEGELLNRNPIYYHPEKKWNILILVKNGGSKKIQKKEKEVWISYHWVWWIPNHINEDGYEFISLFISLFGNVLPSL